MIRSVTPKVCLTVSRRGCQPRMMLRTEFIRYLPSIVLELYDVRSVVRENLLESFLHFDAFYWLFYTIVFGKSPHT